MISKKDKHLIKDILGHRYVASIKEVLNSKGLKTRSNEEYSGGQIRNVMNGEKNEVIEEAIFEAVAIAKKKRKIISQRRKRLLKKNNL